MRRIPFYYYICPKCGRNFQRSELIAKAGTRIALKDSIIVLKEDTILPICREPECESVQLTKRRDKSLDTVLKKEKKIKDSSDYYRVYGEKIEYF